jgi:hypothetical protein
MQKIRYFVVVLFIVIFVTSATLSYKHSSCSVRYHSTILPQSVWLKNTTFEIGGYNITIVYIEGGNPSIFSKNGSSVMNLNPLDDVIITVTHGNNAQSVSYGNYASEAPLFSNSFFHNDVILSTNQNSVNAIASHNVFLNITVAQTCK